MAKKTVELDADTYVQVEEIAKNNGYDTVEKFIESLLSEVIKESKSSEVSKEDEEKIKERLKNLGYLE